MYKAKRGLLTPKMFGGQHEGYPKKSGQIRMHDTNVKNSRKLLQNSDDILRDIIKEAKGMRSSYRIHPRDDMDRPLDSRMIQSTYNMSESKYLEKERPKPLFQRDHMKEKYTYPVKYPPMTVKIVRDPAEVSSNLEKVSLKVALRKIQNYLCDKEFTFNTAIMCLDQSLHVTHCPFFLDYSVRKGYVKEGVLKFGNLIIGYGKSPDEEETQKLAYIDALRALKFKSVEEILNRNEINEPTSPPPRTPPPLALPVREKTLSELIIIEKDEFAVDRFKYSVSILHNSVLANKMHIKWDYNPGPTGCKVNVYIQDKRVGTGEGTGRPEAKKNAACDALFNFFYKNCVILQIASDVESNIMIPYTNVMYFVNEVKRRKISYPKDIPARNGPFAIVIENLLDSYTWTAVNNQLVFGPGIVDDEAETLRIIGERRNLIVRKKKYNDGFIYCLRSVKDFSEIIKYLHENGGASGRYRLVPKSEIPELKAIRQQYYQQYRMSSQIKVDENERPGSYGNIGDSSTNMNQDSYDFQGGYNYSDNNREYDSNFVNPPNFPQSNINLEEPQQIPNVDNTQYMNSNSSYYDRNYASNPYERETNVHNQMNSDVNMNRNEGPMYSYNQRPALGEEDRYNSMNNQGNSYPAQSGFNQRSYDSDYNPTGDTNTYSGYYGNNFDSTTGNNNEGFSYNNNNNNNNNSNNNNRASCSTGSYENYHSRAVYEYDNVHKTDFNSSSMYNSRDTTAAPKEQTGYNQDYCARNPVQNYGQEYPYSTGQHNTPYMYEQGNQMNKREEMFDNRNSHPMSGREFNDNSGFQNKLMGQNQRPDSSFNQIGNQNSSSFKVKRPGLGRMFGNAKAKAYEKELKIRKVAINIGNNRSRGKSSKRWTTSTNSKVSGNASTSAAQYRSMRSLAAKVNARASSKNLTPLMSMEQTTNNNQVMLLKLLTKKIAQRALQSNVKNIIANATRLSNIAKSRQLMERSTAQLLSVPKKRTRRSKRKPDVAKTPNSGTAKQTPRSGTAKQTPRSGTAQQTPRSGTAQQTPRSGTAKQTPKSGTAKQTPKNGTAKQTPKTGTAKQTPKIGIAKQTPKSGTVKQTPNTTKNTKVKGAYLPLQKLKK